MKLLLPLRLGFRAPLFAPLFPCALMAVSSWAMVEVLMLGVVVALVKLGHMASASAGVGLWAYGVTMLLLTLLSSSLQGSDDLNASLRPVRAGGASQLAGSNRYVAEART